MPRLLALALVLALASPAVAGTVRGKVVVNEKGGRPAPDLSDVVVWVEGGKPRTSVGEGKACSSPADAPTTAASRLRIVNPAAIESC